MTKALHHDGIARVLSAATDIRSLRVARSMAQRELAAAIRVPVSELRAWERGFESPPETALRRLAAILACDPVSLAAAQREFSRQAVRGEGYTTAVPRDTGVVPRIEEPPAHRLRVLDLFCGSGGFSYGFEMSGRFVVTAGIDLLPDRSETFRRNHRSAATIVGDIRTYSIDALNRAALSPDVIIGGPPCQGFSSIRPFRTLTEDDPRNNLFERFALIVRNLRPRWFVLENVVGLLSHSRGAVLAELIHAFGEAGYRSDWRILNAAQYGLPQNRERLIVIGSREGRRFEWPQPTHDVNHRSMAGNHAQRVHSAPLFSGTLDRALTVMDAIHDLPPIAAGESASEYLDVSPTPYEKRLRNGAERLTLHEATAHSERMLEIVRRAGRNRYALPQGLTNSGFSSSYSRLAPDEPSVTLTVNFVHPASNKCIHPYQDRALTPREGARLQGFPDPFEFAGTRSQIVKQIGNAVPPLLGEVVARALGDQW